MMNKLFMDVVAVIIAVMISLGGTYTMLITSDTTSKEKIKHIEQTIRNIPDMEKNCRLNSQRITYHERLVGKEIDTLKDGVALLQKSSNILTVQVSELMDGNHRILGVLENLNTSINGLNTTIARMDERVKTVEKGNH